MSLDPIQESPNSASFQQVIKEQKVAFQQLFQQWQREVELRQQAEAKLKKLRQQLKIEKGLRDTPIARDGVTPAQVASPSLPTASILNDRLQFMQQIAELIPGLFYVYDLLEACHLYINRSLTQWLGYTAEQIQEIETDLIPQLVHPEDLEKIRDRYQHLSNLRDGEVLEIEYRMRHANGEWRWLQNREIVLNRTQEGQPQQLLGIAQEVSDRKRVEKTLQEKQHWIEAVAQAIPGLIYIYDIAENRNLYTSPNLSEILGYATSEIQPLGSTFWSAIMHPADWANVSAGRTLGDREVFESEYRLQDATGQWHWFMGRDTVFVRNPDGSPRQILSVAIDINKQQIALRDRELAELALQRLNNELEIRVQKRTAELRGGNQLLREEIIERWRAENALRESEERFRELAENIQSVFWMIDLQKQEMIYVSAAFEKIWGRSRAELYDRSTALTDWIHSDDRDRVIAAQGKQILGEYDEEYRIVKPDGEIRWVRDRAFPVCRATGEVYRIAGIAEDISDRKGAEEALRESEARLQVLIANLFDGLLIVDSEGRVRFANPAACKLFAQPLESLIGERLGVPLFGENAVELCIIRPSGEMGVGEMHVARAEWGGESVCIVSLRDITERRRAELALRESEERFRELAENIQDCFWLLSADMTELLYVSPAYEQIFGRSCKEMYTRPQVWLDWIYPEDRALFLNKLPQVLQGICTSTEYRLLRPDGTVRWVCDRAFPILNESGQVYRIAGICEDISDRKSAEERLKAAVEEKEVLLREIHHRVKNNMQVISSLLQLQAQYIADEQTVALFEESQTRLAAMALIHEQLYQSPYLDRIEVAEYIENIVHNLFQSYGCPSDRIQLQLSITPISLNLETAIPCGLMINELVSNSLKYAFPRQNQGTIRIDFRPIDAQRFYLCVSDNGVGFPQSFNQDNTETLGLRLVQMLSRQLGGSIEIVSRDGTSFAIIFSELNYRRRI